METKSCKYCGETKEAKHFYRFGRKCINCYREAYKKNKAAYNARSIRWQKQNREKCAAFRKAYSEKYGGLIRHRKLWNKFQRIGILAQWADWDGVLRIYELAFAKTKESGIKHCVDHIVPINSPLVCGLHCEDNLQIMTRAENDKKGNHLLPDISFWSAAA